MSWCDNKYNTKFDYVVHVPHELTLPPSPPSGQGSLHRFVSLLRSLCLSPGNRMRSHIGIDERWIIDVESNIVCRTMFMYSISQLHRWFLYCFYTFSIGGWCVACVFAAKQRSNASCPIRSFVVKKTCVKVTYIRFRGFCFIAFRSEVFVGRWFVSSSRIYGRQATEDCIWLGRYERTFIIGKILCVPQTTHHIRHVRCMYDCTPQHSVYINMEFP